MTTHEIPEFIKNSDLYKSLDDPNDLSCIPEKYLKYMNNQFWILPLDKFSEYLNFLQYWMVNECPPYAYDLIFDYVGSFDRNEIIKQIYSILDEFTGLPFVKELKFLAQLFCDKFNHVNHVHDYNILTKIVQFDSKGLFDWAKGCGYKGDYYTTAMIHMCKNKNNYFEQSPKNDDIKQCDLTGKVKLKLDL